MQKDPRALSGLLGRSFAALVLAATFVALPTLANAAPSQPAGPNEFDICNPGSSGGNVNTCLYVDGAGLFVREMQATAAVVSYPKTLKECLTNPAGNVITCDPQGFVNVAPGHLLDATWNALGNVAPGTYCAITTRLNPDNTQTIIGSTCGLVSGS